MTSDFNSPDMPQEQFDIGPLSWVMGEVRESVNHAGKMLQDALAQDADSRSTALLHAKSYLHQAHGALQIVDIDGVSLVTETIEDLLERLQSQQLAMSQANIDVITEAFQAVLRYLEDLLAGLPHQPVRLFPYYRALLEVKGADRIHPADLFFPSLSAQEQIPEFAVNTQATALNYGAVRLRLEKLLLGVLTAKEPAQLQAAAKNIQELVSEVEQAQQNSQAKAFWVVLRAFVEGVANGSIAGHQYVKQIFGRINLQIRRLAEGSNSIPERLLRDALFFLAQVSAPTELISKVRRAYQLETQVPADYEQKNYGLIAAADLSNTKEQLAAAKNLWGRIANGESGLAEKFSQKMLALSDAGQVLNNAALSKLLRELSGIARHAAHSDGASKLGLELATSLLFVENALDQIARLPAHFAERADEITARLLGLVSGEAPQAEAAWMGEISREAQQKQTMSVLVAEMQSSLRHVEKALDEYFRDAKQLQQIADIPGCLHQVGGALAILDYDDALQAVEHTRSQVLQFLENTDAVEINQEQLARQQNVAQNVGALTFFIETLQSQPDTIKKKFSFDPETKVLRSNLLETQSSKELLPTTTIVADTQVIPQTAEQELLQKQQESSRLAASLAEAPDNQALRDQLKQALESERSVANLLDDSAAKQRVNSAIDKLKQTEAAVQVVEQAVVAPAVVEEASTKPQPAVTIPDGDDAIDAELLEIFLGEADEVLGFVRETLPVSERHPDNHEHLTSLRRSFHTLKGSSRMVGLNVFGEAGWAIEQVMNLWLSESRDGNSELYALLHQAEKEMFAWVSELQKQGHSARTGKALIAAAEQLKNNGKFIYDESLNQPATLPPEVEIQVLDAELESVQVPEMVESGVETLTIETPESFDEQLTETISVAAHGTLPESGISSVQTLVVSTLPEAEASIEIQAPTELSEIEPDLSELDQEAGLALSAERDTSVVEPNVSDAATVSDDLTIEELLPPVEFATEASLTTEQIADDLQVLATPDLTQQAAVDIDVTEPQGREPEVILESITEPEIEITTLTAEPQVFSELLVSEEADTSALTAAEETKVEVLSDLDLSGLETPELDGHERVDSVASELAVISLATADLPLPDTAAESVTLAESDEAIGLSEPSTLELVTADTIESDADLVAHQADQEVLELEIHGEIPNQAEPELEIAALDYTLTSGQSQQDDTTQEIVVEDVQVIARQSSDQITADTTSALDTEGKTETGDIKASAQIIEFPDRHAQPTLDDNIKRIGHLEISLPLYGIYMAETDEIVRFLTQDFSEWRHEPHRAVTTHSIHATHTLAGSSATVGLKALQELAHTLEVVLQRLQRHPVALLAAEFDLLDQVLDSAKRMLQQFALSELAEHDPLHVNKLEHMLAAVVERSSVGEDEEFITSTNEKLDPATLTQLIEQESPNNSPESGLVPVDSTRPAESEIDDAPAELEFTLAEPVAEEIAVDADELVSTESDVVPAMQEPTLLIGEAADAQLALQPEAQSHDATIDTLTETVTAAFVPDYTETLTISALDAEPAEEIRVADELDQDLLPVFIEEGNDLLPMVGELLRNWQSSPADQQIPQSIARLMHTIKGSARMAGAMRLGQHIHDMETRIESLMHGASAGRLPLIEDLLARHDMALQMFDRLQNPQLDEVQRTQAQELSAAQDLDTYQEKLEQQAPQEIPAVAESVSSELAIEPAQPASAPELVSLMPVLNPANFSMRSVAPAKPAATTVNPTGPAPLVRVRADVLDRLVNQAGEVSISRSRLENEVTILRSSLNELTDNVNRLRDQLREVEIQAETQITSRMAHSADREFDPLEFDRFTRLQELTRMMAESVADVATVQNNLNRTIDGASTDLQVQARLTRELQQDLMRVRMIPFASISERLYRVTRQASKEVDKRVNLDIRGANVEMDRSVLEKMAGPFEHLLRNAIVHGIENRDLRRHSGKAEIGELLVEVRQEGNEVVICFRDDGQGLNLQRIREKALAIGMITKDEHPADAEVASMIFEPGFSTASEVTELAGRGVGMDVVRSEAASLGGRVEVASEPGKGAEFTIRLPLTLAVNQVVLVSSGGRTYAVPSVLVEQVQQLKANALANAYNEGAVMWQGQRINLYYLSYMLGQHEATPTAQQYTPIMIMKSAGERVAIHVDDILGNREVVVKNIGPQLARMAGIAGASVLGSGDIVLILDPVPLAHRMEHEFARTHQSGQVSVAEVGAVADLQLDQKTAMVTADAVPGLRTQHTVMVVDDSLTVRRVTQRLLTREGYQVILAKDGIDALEQLQSVKPDVMLVDIEMPRMDGFDLTRNVRSDSRTADIPIIMITSRTADKHRNYAKELGVNEYFGKPYREDDLLHAISHFIQAELASM